MGFVNEEIANQFKEAYFFLPYIPDDRFSIPDSKFTWENCFRELGRKPWWDLVAEAPIE